MSSYLKMLPRTSFLSLSKARVKLGLSNKKKREEFRRQGLCYTEKSKLDSFGSVNDWSGYVVKYLLLSYYASEKGSKIQASLGYLIDRWFEYIHADTKRLTQFEAANKLFQQLQS